ncbi:50S ribosomal protein L11 methyltransferase [Bacteroides sp. OttesenSCG-928-D19]|nr:50S ribosomal protein L11 methyltransferase [Bacteroides sp. OttesenSCG-928-N06]MDL2304580.1 50S ribosomal protein L11 methyltransferase [Bacteroides sp. OttesenSCG-928-D19]
MKYLEFQFHTTPCTETVNDVLSAVLAEAGFDSFTDNDLGINAYILKELFDEKILEDTLRYFPLENTQITYTWKEAEDKDWNEEWEKNYFQPIVIDDRCVVHSTFHQNIPQVEYDILINPQMAFGTGHHETTSLIISELLNMNLENKSVLDMGCGTSILAILARMRGAKPITAIDIDDWCVQNSKENIELNHLTDIKVELGDAGLIGQRGPFDIIIANINRNILLNDMHHYVENLNPGGELYMSGFYVEDIPLIKEKAESLGLTFGHHKEKNNWAAVKFEKKK